MILLLPQGRWLTALLIMIPGNPCYKLKRTFHFKYSTLWSCLAPCAFINWTFTDLLTKETPNSIGIMWLFLHLRQDFRQIYNPKMSFEKKSENFLCLSYFCDLRLKMLACDSTALLCLCAGGSVWVTLYLFSGAPLWWCPWQKHLTSPAPAVLLCICTCIEQLPGVTLCNWMSAKWVHW